MKNGFFFTKKQLQLINILIFIGLLICAVLYFDLHSNFNLVYLRQIIEQNGVVGLLFFIVLFVIGNFIQIPGMVFLAAAVITLGKTAGGLVTYGAAVTSCVVIFLIIRAIGGDALRQLETKWANKVFHQLDNKPIRSTFILRTVFQTFTVLSYGFALSGIKFKHHFIGTLLALPLPIFLYTLFFDYLAKAAGII